MSRIFFVLGVLSFLVSCSTNHSVQATLYKEEKPESSVYKFVGFSSNPIFVDEKSTFEIRMTKIRPGWIHQGVKQKKPLEQWNAIQNCEENEATVDKVLQKRCFYTNWDNDIADQLYGKELWVLTKIESVNANDVLEKSNKVFFKATNVKLNALSFLPIPLDVSELDLFTHRADSAYRMTIKIYEVQAFNIKREAFKTYSSNPGLIGLFASAGNVLKNTLGALGGEVIENWWEKNNEDEQFVERILLSHGAVVEFQGSIHILRKKNQLSLAKGHLSKAQEYLLYDPYKSRDFDSAFEKKDTYAKNLLDLSQDVDLNVDRIDRTFIKLRVEQSLTHIPETEEILKARRSEGKLIINGTSAAGDMLNAAEAEAEAEAAKARAFLRRIKMD